MRRSRWRPRGFLHRSLPPAVVHPPLHRAPAVYALRILLVLLLSLPLASACGGDGAVTPEPEPKPKPQPEPEPEPPVSAYTTPPPNGKLPWPHHSPAFDEARYQQMLRDLFIINNYGLMQASADGTLAYLHGALDVVLPNGTPIFAIYPGTVVAEIGSTEFYRTLIVEDEGRPGEGWGYTHVNFFKVQVGDRVQQGTPLASVHFQGVEHIHLSRMRRVPGGQWTDWESLEAVYPDSFFVYTDGEAPVFDARLRYARNGSTAFFVPEGDDPVVVFGEVDIVAGIRDGGEYAQSKQPLAGEAQYGNRNAVMRVEYDIRGNGVEVSATALDLREGAISLGQALTRPQALLLYHVAEQVRPDAPLAANNNRRFSYYVLTNQVPGQPFSLNPQLSANAWKTNEVLPTGQRRFPNGDYVVTVRAYDNRGNLSVHSETVRVQN